MAPRAANAIARQLLSAAVAATVACARGAPMPAGARRASAGHRMHRRSALLHLDRARDRARARTVACPTRVAERPPRTSVTPLPAGQAPLAGKCFGKSGTCIVGSPIVPFSGNATTTTADQCCLLCQQHSFNVPAMSSAQPCTNYTCARPPACCAALCSGQTTDGRALIACARARAAVVARPS